MAKEYMGYPSKAAWCAASFRPGFGHELETIIPGELFAIHSERGDLLILGGDSAKALIASSPPWLDTLTDPCHNPNVEA